MDLIIKTARDVHGVRDEAQFRRFFEAAIARKVRHGQRVQVHEVSDPVEARIDHGRWLIDCACGAGNACDASWSAACCLECGAVHTQVRYPSNRHEIEALILDRPATATRNWRPREDVTDLARENLTHGIRPKGAR